MSRIPAAHLHLRLLPAIEQGHARLLPYELRRAVPRCRVRKEYSSDPGVIARLEDPSLHRGSQRKGDHLLDWLFERDPHLPEPHHTRPRAYPHEQ